MACRSGCNGVGTELLARMAGRFWLKVLISPWRGKEPRHLLGRLPGSLVVPGADDATFNFFEVVYLFMFEIMCALVCVVSCVSM